MNQSDRMDRNGEGYPDPTAGAAHRNMQKEKQRREEQRQAAINSLIPIMKEVAALAGFEVVGRITLRDRFTGKEYR